MNDLKFSWKRAWANLDLLAPSNLFERLVSAYDEPHRQYHTLQHLNECIAHFSGVMDLAKQPGEVEIALWFHDAIYDLRGKTNECLSADWATQMLNEQSASNEVQARVQNLIMATSHNAMPSESDQQLLVDIDLAILGSPPARFSEYDRQVKSEYSWVPGFLYRMKRKQVLKGFFSREYIYSTKPFRDRLEQQARVNLRAAIG